jgi:hypothetical protein
LKYLTKKRHEEKLLPDCALPTLDQLQNYVSRSGKAKNSNAIDQVQEFIASNMFNPTSHSTESNSFFFYGMQLDSNGRPIVGDGFLEFRSSTDGLATNGLLGIPTFGLSG